MAGFVINYDQIIFKNIDYDLICNNFRNSVYLVVLICLLFYLNKLLIVLLNFYHIIYSD